jgi:hypothetical protein
VKLIWHIGPHKTGTTSLQRSLAAQASSRRASFYYPPTPELGPGHALLAWRLLGLNGRDTDESVIQAELDNAARRGFDKVVLSSEEFCRALMKPDRFAPIARVASSVECELVLTLRPLQARLMPELQEMIKNGNRINLNNGQEVLDAVMTRPGLRPDLLTAAINEVSEAQITVVMVDTSLPQRLFEAMSIVVGDQLPIPKAALDNPSYPFLQTAWLDVLNRHANMAQPVARDIAEAAFTSAVQHRPELSSVPYPPLPRAIEIYAEAVWSLQLSYLASMQAAGRLRWL